MADVEARRLHSAQGTEIRGTVRGEVDGRRLAGAGAGPGPRRRWCRRLGGERFRPAAAGGGRADARWSSVLAPLTAHLTGLRRHRGDEPAALAAAPNSCPAWLRCRLVARRTSLPERRVIYGAWRLRSSSGPSRMYPRAHARAVLAARARPHLLYRCRPPFRHTTVPWRGKSACTAVRYSGESIFYSGATVPILLRSAHYFTPEKARILLRCPQTASH